MGSSSIHLTGVNWITLNILFDSIPWTGRPYDFSELRRMPEQDCPFGRLCISYPIPLALYMYQVRRMTMNDKSTAKKSLQMLGIASV